MPKPSQLSQPSQPSQLIRLTRLIHPAKGLDGLWGLDGLDFQKASYCNWHIFLGDLNLQSTYLLVG